MPDTHQPTAQKDQDERRTIHMSAKLPKGIVTFTDDEVFGHFCRGITHGMKTAEQTPVRTPPGK